MPLQRTLLLSIVIVSVTVGYSPFFSSARSGQDSTTRYGGRARAGFSFSRTNYPQAYIVEATDQGSKCRGATREEAELMARRIPDSSLHVITPIHKGLRPEAGVGGLQIILRGTSQLDQFPQTKAAFLKAAANWEAVIATPISIVVDVDFGPNAFGKAFAANVIAETDPQVVGGDNLYTHVKNFLIGDASTAADLTLYNALPSGSSVPTDLGSTGTIDGPTAVFRATGLLPSVADPTGDEAAGLGTPPRVAFNSTLQYTFDPTAGIAPNSLDFDAAATHEIGHVLGFHSSVGETEQNPTLPLSVSEFDLFRFRPGTTTGTFGIANRIESSGGDQDFFFGGPEVALSTGRPDGMGGDGYQASHWKSVDITGTLIGIMDPSIAPGERRTISSNDQLAFEAMGYSSQNVAPPGTVALTSGTAVTGSASIPTGGAGSCVLGGTQYMIAVPDGATQLTVDITGDEPSTDLFVRYGRTVTIVENALVNDYQTPTSKASQEIVVSGSSSPPIASGNYFIAVGNCAAAALHYTVTATVTGGATGGGATVITALSANLQGNTLTLTGTATNPNGNIAQADVTLLDGAGHTAGDTGPFSASFGTATTSNFTLSVNNMQNFLSAVKASVVLADSTGAKSAAFIADFSQADTGGPQVTNVSYDGSLMIVKGNGFATPIQLESNGVLVNIKIKIKGGGSKLKISGASSDLNLVSGANRIRVLVNALRSNIFVLVN